MPLDDHFVVDMISIHALLAESDRCSTCLRPPCGIFLSTLSLRRATYLATWQSYHVRDFYPRSPCGERPAGWRAAISERIFLSTLSLRRATFSRPLIHHQSAFLSTLSLRRATGPKLCQFFGALISIHALLAESDQPNLWEHYQDRISIHALLAESDNPKNEKAKTSRKFLSTLSLRRATCPPVGGLLRSIYFYPRSPCGERQDLIAKELTLAKISIHALLAESDRPTRPCKKLRKLFLSTLSLRRATSPLMWPWSPLKFLSTLSLRRATRQSSKTERHFPYFYPRSPCGERPEHKGTNTGTNRFLSTLSLRRATTFAYVSYS